MGEIPANRLIAFTRMTDLEGKRTFQFPDIRGWKVLNTTGHEVGKVEEVFVDPNTLEPAMALLKYQKFLNRNTKKLLVPWNEVQILGEGKVRTRPTEEQFADAPEWQEEMSDWTVIAEYWEQRGTFPGGTTASASEEEYSLRG
jgi:sporulation protein YlmC with PRC-barrel domain